MPQRQEQEVIAAKPRRVNRFRWGAFLVASILGSAISLFLGMLVAIVVTGPIVLTLLPYPSLYWPFLTIGFVIGGLAFYAIHLARP